MTTTTTTVSSNWQRLATIATLLSGIAFLLVSFSSNENDIAPRRNLAATPAECEQQCKDPPLKDLQHFDGNDLLKPKNMLERLKKQRALLLDEQLKKDYGAEYYQNIFQPMEGSQRVSVGRNRVFRDVLTLPKTKQPGGENLPEESSEAWTRFIRKMKMKIIQIQLSILEERQNAKGICLDECGADDEQGSRFLKTAPSTGLYNKFTWATGGHSASAGHGNLFRESYTANMDRAVTPIFKSIGLDFEARNYAMGGTDCAEEVALCMNQIFGKDIDFISWDYGMTDGHALFKMAMYLYKAAQISKITDNFSQPGQIAHRPAFFALYQSETHNLAIEELQKLGLTALAFTQTYMNDVVVKALPDMMGMTDEQIQKLAPFVQYYKCEGGLENGEPGCKDNKYNDTICQVRKAKASWHPGYRHHKLLGNLMAITLLDIMEDSLQSLIDDDTEAGVGDNETIEEAKNRLAIQLRALDEQEKAAYANIFSSPIPEVLQPHLEKWWDGEKPEHLEDVNLEAFFKEPSFCHSAILPSEARFLGLVTENSTAVGRILDQNYEEGVSSDELARVENPGPRASNEAAAYVTAPGDDKIMLVRDDHGRQNCEEYLNLDYKDYFQVSNIEGWRSLKLPNDAERKAYTEFDGKKSQGYVLACLVRCDWGKCPPGDLHNYFGWMEQNLPRGQEPPSPEELAKMPHVEILINGEPVVEASDMHTCYALKNKDGHVWKADADGRYEIKIRVTESEQYSFIRISAFVIV